MKDIEAESAATVHTHTHTHTHTGNLEKITLLIMKKIEDSKITL